MGTFVFFRSLFCGMIFLLLVLGSKAQDWRLTGNPDATATSKLGPTVNQPLIFITNNVERMRLDALGRLGIGITSPNASSQLDIVSTTRGILLPRMTMAQRNLIAAPATGLLIFQTDGVKGFYYYDAGWKAVTPAISGFANTALSNLANTSVNTDILPSANHTRNLGSGAKGWKDLFLSNEVWLDNFPFIRNRGANSAFIGANAGNSISQKGADNTGAGHQSLYRDTTGVRNSALGAFSMWATTNGSDNVGVGAYAMYNNNTGWANVAVGSYALNRNSAGYYNTAIGSHSLYSNSTAYHNTAVGYATLYTNSTGANNVAVGNYALGSSTTGLNNTAVGYFSLYINNVGQGNTALGYYSAHKTQGSYNTAVGYEALFSNGSGLYNTALGYQSIYNNTTNAYNTAVGLYSGYYSSSAGTFVGAYAYSNSNVTNATALGYAAFVDASNKVRVGNSSVTSIGGQVGWTIFSDGRYKKNIKEDVPGLEFINSLRPVTYTVDIETIHKQTEARRPKANNSSKSAPSPVGENASPNQMAPPVMAVAVEFVETEEDVKGRKEASEIIHTGFLAQEVEEAAKKLNYNFDGVDKPKNPQDYYGLRYAEFVVPLVKAVQELSAKVDELEEKIRRLEAAATRTGTGSAAYLQQNAPNPFSSATTIQYYVPQETRSANVVITNMKGQVLQKLNLSTMGNGQVRIEKGLLPAGSYSYTLWADGKKADTRKMVITR